MAVPGTNSLLTDDEVQRALAEVEQLEPPDLGPPPPPAAFPPSSGPQSSPSVGPQPPPTALNSPIQEPVDVVAIPVPAPQYSDRSPIVPQPGESAPPVTSAESTVRPSVPAGLLIARLLALLAPFATPLRSLLSRVASLLRRRARRGAGGAAPAAASITVAAAQAAAPEIAEPAVAGASASAPAAEESAPAAVAAESAPAPAPAASPERQAKPVVPLGVRFHNLIEGALARLDEPFVALEPAHKKLIGFAAITTIAVCVFSMFVLPILFPRKDVTWFVEQKKAAMLAAPPPGAAAEGHGGGH